MTDLFWPSPDGLMLHAVDYQPEGKEAGLPIICIPGLTRNNRDFSDFCPWAAGIGHRVIALSLRGRGRSEPDPRPRRYRPDTYAKDILALMDRLAMPRAIFVGTSLGGLVIMELAHKAPARVAAAVLNDIGPGVDRRGLARIASYAGTASPVKDWQGAADHCRRINAVAFPDFGDEDWRRFARRTFVGGPDGVPVLDYDRAIFRPTPAWLIPALEWHLRQRFRALAKARPVLALRGALSDILSTGTLAEMRQMGSDVTVCEVPGVGHAPMLSEPAARAALAAFFGRLSAE